MDNMHHAFNQTYGQKYIANLNDTDIKNYYFEIETGVSCKY